MISFWKFPYQYRVKRYDYWTFKVEKWFLGLKLVAWNVECFVWDDFQWAEVENKP